VGRPGRLADVERGTYTIQVRLGARAPLAAELAALAAIVAAHVYLLTRLLHTRTSFDEGVLLLALHSLNHGEALGRQVFASQGPVFYVLLRAIGGVFGTSVGDVRLGMALVAAVGAVLAYLLGRRLGGPLSGLACAALVAISPKLSYLGGQVFADLPAMVLVLGSFVALSRRRMVLAGGLFAAALLVKLSAVAALPTLLVLLALEPARRRRLLAAAAGAAVVFAVTALVFVRDLRPLWTDGVIYHLRSRAQIGVSGSHQYAAFFNVRTPFCWFVIAGLAFSLLHWRRVWPYWIWTVAASVFVLEYHPLRENGLLAVPYSLAVPAGLGLGLTASRLPRFVLAPAIAAAAAGFAAGWVQQLHLIRHDILEPEDPALVRAAAQLGRVTNPGDLVISDQPIVALLAHRRVPGNYVDTASLRWDTHTLSDAEVVRDAQHVAAVVAGRAFANRPTLMTELRPLFRHRLVLPGATIFYGPVNHLGSGG
jgi:4-amino-4-deoxy-L-arabinose transferase-like glycosyltransferase